MDGAGHRRFLFFALPVALMVGAATGAAAALGLAAACAGLLALALRASRLALAGLRVSRSLYPSAFEDETVRVELRLENRSRRTASLLDLADSFGPGVADRQALLEPGPLGPRRRRVLAYRASCSKPWGEYPVGPLALAACDPLGLFAARRVVPATSSFTVFPRVHAVAALDRLGARPTFSPHEATAGRSGHSLDYLGAREFRPGDDARRIHWPATARRGALVVKEYELDLVPYLTLFLDLHRAGRAGTGRKSTLEYLVRTAASIAWSAASRGDVVELLAEAERSILVPPGRGELHVTQCLYELVRVRQDGGTDLLDLVETHRARLPAGSTAILLVAGLGFDDDRLAETLEALRARAVRPAVIVVNDSSFLPVDRLALPPERVRARCEQIRALLQSRGVAGAVLGAEHDLGRELGRPDLLEAQP